MSNGGLVIWCATVIVCGLVFAIAGDIWYVRALGSLMLLAGGSSAGMLLVGRKSNGHI